jgi:hypothetical protein
MAEIILGVVSKVEDPNKFIIRFTTEDYIEDCIAYPIDTFDQPEVGDPIVLFGLESVLGYSYLWQKQRLFDHTRLKHDDSIIEIKTDEINIVTGSSSIKMKKGGDIEIKGSSSIKIDSSNVTITGGKLTAKGTANNDTLGFFNPLKFCPYSGAPHCGSIASGT